MTNMNSLRRWRIFQLILSSVILVLEISNIILYESFNPTETDINWNYEFRTLRDKNKFIIAVVGLPTILASLLLLVYVLFKGENSTKRDKLIKKAELFKNIEAGIKQSNETGSLNRIIGQNISSVLLFAWSLAVILNMILFHKNWDLVCNRLEGKERSSILCNDFIINLVLNITMFFSCIYITFMKLFHSSYKDKTDEINLKI
ncbi:hypothetical protein C1645_874461 [Glomus cerebriforme]|uniref:Uncharacterized protein n=1 Tax=Glomus cerebriforme TaxID=658196 RepID=A0A397T3B4_9GLOM|nr:hypothetical protein C1645_874461 [Glomus cerebriforme]